jgi:GMP synthase (glutamine-hydrolysing)
MFRAAPHVYGVQFHPECTLDIIKHWTTEAAHRLEERGAQQIDEQIANAEKYDHRVEAWVPGFIDRWLGLEPTSSTAREAAE